MIIALRLQLIAILVAWQIFPALAHTDLIGSPLWGKIGNALEQTEDNQSTPFFADSDTEQAELLNERPGTSITLLALIPESTTTLPLKTGGSLFFTHHRALTGSSEFLYRDRGPPRLLS